MLPMWGAGTCRQGLSRTSSQAEGKRAGLSSGLLAAAMPREGSQLQEVPEVQLGTVVGVSVGEVLVLSGDVVVDRPSSADTPSRVESKPLSCESPGIQVPV